MPQSSTTPRSARGSIFHRIFRTLRRSPLSRITAVTRLYREVVVLLHGSDPVQVGEFSVAFDPRDCCIAPKLIVDGGFEQKEIELFCSLIEPAGTGRAVKVFVRRGVELLRELGVDMPSMIKIDVEGAEPLVISGLECHPKYIQFEYVPSQLRAMQQDPIGFLDQLVSDGYQLAVIDRDTGELHSTVPQCLLKVADRSGLDYNVMAIMQ